MKALAIKPELSLNTVVALLAVAGVVYLGYKLKNGVSDTLDNVGKWWDGLDLNPFDSNGTVTQLITQKTEPDSVQSAAKKAMSAKGKNIDDYRFYYPAIEGKKLPSGTWTVKYQGKTHYLAPKNTLFGSFTL